MNKQIGTVTAAEMLAELDALPASTRDPITPDDARTIKEWAAEWGIARQRASSKIRVGLDAGLFEKVQRKRERLDGRICGMTCYRWVIGKKK